jgi:two-component system NtrC family sensor kinase
MPTRAHAQAEEAQRGLTPPAEKNRPATVMADAHLDQPALYSRMMQTDKMAALGQLVSGIAHELNNPLTSIMGYAQLLLARSPGRRDATSGRYLSAATFRDILRDAEHIYREAERAGHIVKNLLLFSREMPPERSAVDLNEIVERTLALRSYELKVENIRVDLQFDPSLPPTLADPHQLQQVVLNLLVNAEQAILSSTNGARQPSSARSEAMASADQGSIRIRTHTPAGSQPPRIALSISDTGPGIPPDIAARVFDPFFTTKPMGVGTGLGLSIVYGIVREHGGDIYLETPSSPSEETSHGATFVVELPVMTACEAPAGLPALVKPPAEEVPRPALESVPPRPAASLRRSAPLPANGPRISVLVVEDEPTVAQLIADVLKEEGHRVEIVLDSREAFARVQRFVYDVIICDLRMPRLDGRAFYRLLGRSAHPAQQRILFVTGDILSPRTLDFLKQTGLPFLAKPFLVEELKTVFYRFVETLRASNGASPKGSSPHRGSHVPAVFPPAGSQADAPARPQPEGMRRT